ncbi:LSU ribosomal protein L31E, partial [Giardia duodenalis]
VMGIVYEHTIRLNKAVRGKPSKKAAPIAIRAIRAQVEKLAKVEDVRLDPSVNVFVWSRGIRHVPRRIRLEVRLEGDDEHKFAYVINKDVENFKHLTTEKKGSEDGSE